jgi:glycosyltransferase involved in cell wall biosynthesis
MNDWHAHEDIVRLRDDLSRAVAARDGLASADEPSTELEELLEQQIVLLQGTLDARTALLRIQNGFGWRVLESLRRRRLALRRFVMKVRGLRSRRRRSTISDVVLQAALGVNVAGYLDTESGMGEAARLSIRSLEAAGIPFTLCNVPSRLRMMDSSYTEFTTANPHPFNLVHLNADNMEWFAEQRGHQYFRDRYTIGYWFWELAEFRDDWMPAFDYVDEVWTASEFGRATLAERSPVPVVCMPLPIVAPPLSTCGRKHFGIAADAFMFLFTFDVSSQMERKNPFGLLAAFKAFVRSYAGPRDVVLVLKFTNAEYDPVAVRRLHEAAGGLPVLLLDRYMTRDELAGLMRTADCYVSLHRSEGFGLGIAESMALGKPVIATRYSGPVDLMTDENSYPVECRLSSISRDYGPYLEGFSWADPDVDQASILMQRVVEDRREAAARGRQAAADIAARRAPQQTGERVRQRLEEIRAGRRFDSALAGPRTSSSGPREVSP